MVAVSGWQKFLLILGVIALNACGGGSGEDGYGYVEDNDVSVDASYSCGDAPALYECSKGKISPSGTSYIEWGDSISFKVTHEPGHNTVVRSNCGARTPLKNLHNVAASGNTSVTAGELIGETFTTEAVYGNCSVSVHFLTEHVVSTDAGDHGKISPTREKVLSMSVTRFKISPDDGYVAKKVSGCGTDGVLDGNEYTLKSVTSDCQLVVEYAEIPDMEGVWSGTWEGVDSAFGPVAGTWVLRMSQNNTRLKGPIEFSGDLDCAEGSIRGVADPRDEVITGTVKRFPSPEPCKENSWVFSAFDDGTTSASGTWSKSGLSNGAFEGRRIALPDGPNMHYFFPPWAGAGALVTVVGEKLDMHLVNDSLSLGAGGTVLVPDSASETTIRLRLPGGIGTSQPLHLTTLDGSAISPLPLNTGVTSPATGYTQEIELTDTLPRPGGVVFSINNRRAFVANRGSGSVSMINTEHGVEFTSTPVSASWLVKVALHAVAVHPNGRWVYAAGDGVVGILHAHTMELLDTLDLPAYGSAQGNPQGIAISPDGRWMLLTEAAPGGRVTVVDIANDYRIADTLLMPAGSTPRGVAINPGNQEAYIAVSGNLNEVRVYDLASASLLAPVDAGESPQAVAITPDGSRIFVTNGTAGTIDSYHLASGETRSFALPTGATANALAISPDGAKVFVSTNTSFIYVIDVPSESLISVLLGGASSGIALSRDGRRAYVAQPFSNQLVEIGNQRSLRISKQGGGLGTVTTVPDAIVCGSACSATFDLGTQVKLNTSQPPSGFRFRGWYGDADCSDGWVTMRSNLYCVARFEPIPRPAPPSGGSGGSGSGSSNCFIATAAYGSWLDPQVKTLRLFRDRYLLTNSAGTGFVEFYYEHSPPIADYIREREWLKVTVRSVIAVLIFAIEQPLAMALGLWLLLIIRIQRASTRKFAAVRIGTVESGRSDPGPVARSV